MKKVYRVKMPSGGSAALKIGGFSFRRNTPSEEHLMKLDDRLLKQLESYGFSIEAAPEDADEPRYVKKIRLKEASDEQLNAALIDANLPVNGTRDDKILMLRGNGIANVKIYQEEAVVEPKKAKTKPNEEQLPLLESEAK